MKVGLLTVHRLPNFGSVLQTYALYKTINSLGHDCEIIDYLYPNEWHIRKGCWYPKRNSIKRRIAVALGLRPENFLQRMNKFVFSNMKTSRPFLSYESIHKNPPIYDVYVVGSDQLWNWKTMYMDTTFLLDFAPNTRPCISFSTSIAQNTIPDEFLELYRKNLSKFKAISVREENGQKLLKASCGIDAELVQDPTLLLGKEQWKQLAEKAQFKTKIPSRYILCYTLAYTFDPKPKMNELLGRLEQIYDCPIIMLNIIKQDYMGKLFHFAKNQSIGIPEFLWLIMHSTAIATSSFHGTAFAVNFGKPFYSLIEKTQQDDDRISSFLRIVGLTSQIVTNHTDVQDIKVCSYNIEKVQQSLALIREHSFSFLKDNIK